jgi:hypothetical protein
MPAKPICKIIQMTDWVKVTCPEGIGLDLVLSTAPSIFLSEMSFHVQPAPRISKAPTEHEKKSQKSLEKTFPSCRMPISKPHQHGINNNQVPTGRSARDNRK